MNKILIILFIFVILAFIYVEQEGFYDEPATTTPPPKFEAQLYPSIHTTVIDRPYEIKNNNI
jgi:hypothetical protein